MTQQRGTFDETMLGYPVFTEDGTQLGKVKEVQGDRFKVDAPMQPDFWLSTSAIASASGGQVMLSVNSDRLDEYRGGGVGDRDTEYTRTAQTTTAAAGTAGHTHEAHDHTHGASMEATAPAQGTVRAEGEQTVQLREEELRANKETVQAGEVGVRKEVVAEEQTVDVPVRREEVVIERRPVEGRAPAQGEIGEGEEIRVPVMAERADVEKETVVTEEVSIGKRQVEETEQVTDTVRREEARLERSGDVDIRGSGGESSRR